MFELNFQRKLYVNIETNNNFAKFFAESMAIGENICHKISCVAK